MATIQNDNQINSRIVRAEEVRKRIGDLSRARFAQIVADGIFPKPFTIIPGGRAVGWLESDVDAWILARSQASQEAAR